MKNAIQLLLLAAISVLAYQAASQSGRNPLTGAWIIVETTITDSGEATVNGEPQPGLYIFTDRHFSTMLVPGTDRPPFSAGRTDAERLAAYDNFVADAGTYELQGNMLMTGNIIAKIPNGMTARIPYRVGFEGEDLILTLESAWAPPNGSITYRLRRLE
jgi:hypothetical protein